MMATGVNGKSWFEKETGVAETGCDSGIEWDLAAQQLGLSHWQHARAELATLTSDAGTTVVHRSTRLQTIASAVFM